MEDRERRIELSNPGDKEDGASMLDSPAIPEYSLSEGESTCSSSVDAAFGA